MSYDPDSAGGGVTINNNLNVSGVSVIAEISGKTVWLASGRNPVQLFALDLSGNQLMPLAVKESGSNVLRVDAAVSVDLSGLSVNANVAVSGETVRISNESGRATAQLFAYDFSGAAWNPVGIDISGGSAIRIAGSLAANISGQAVNVSGNVVTILSGLGVRVSGETVTVVGTVSQTSGTGVRVSGETITFPSGIGVRISGEAVLTSVSGNVIQQLSGTGVRISGESITFLSGIGVRISGEAVSTSVSGNVLSINSGAGVRVSGESVRISPESGRATAELKAYDLSGLAWNPLAVDVSGGNALRIAGSFAANISGQVVSTSGGVVKISGETVVAEISGQVVRISGSVVTVNSGTGVRISGDTIVLTSGAGVRISGETVLTSISGNAVSVSGGVAKISGESVRISTESGRATAELKAYDLSGLTWNPVAVDVSGGNAIRVAATVNASADISGQVVRISEESGRATAQLKAYDLSGLAWNDLAVDVSGGNALRVAGNFNVSANISGQVVSTSGGVVKISGETVVAEVSGQVVRISGSVVVVQSGTGVRVSGETISFPSGIGVRISGEAITFLSGIGVRISGEAVTFLSGIGVRISGESVRISTESGRARAELFAYDLSGAQFSNLLIDNSGTFGRLLVSVSGQSVNLISGAGVRISGESITFLSGIGVRISGEAITFLSGIGVRVSGEVVSTSGGVVKVSGESMRLSTESGRTYVQLKAYDLSGLAWNELAVDVSGGNALRIAGSFSANISGQVVSTSGGVVKISGETVAVTSGTGVRVSGETISFPSGIGVRISGEAITFLSGIGVRISGEAITFLSGIGVRISGEVVNISGMVVSTSGGVVKISGETIQLTSGAGVRVSGEVVRISEESGRHYAAIQGYDLSGAVWRDLITARSGSNLLQVQTQFINPLTYISTAVQDIRSGMYMWLCFNSGVQQVIEMKALYMSYVTPLITSGGSNVPTFELWRITANSGGGSGQNFVRMDPADTTSGIAVQLNINNLSGAGGTDKLFQWNLGLTVSGTAAVSSASNVNLPQHTQHFNALINGVNWIPSQSREMKQPMMRSGFGLAIRQSVNAGYTQIVSGQVYITTVLVVQNSGQTQTY